MEVSAADVAKIPRANIRVPRDEFAAVWRAAEEQCRVRGQRGITDWYAGGVVITCRWLANATVRPASRPWYLAFSPITERTKLAYEELIEAECLEAEKLTLRSPPPLRVSNRPGWLDGILATFGWAWRRSAGPPLNVDGQEHAVG